MYSCGGQCIAVFGVMYRSVGPCKPWMAMHGCVRAMYSCEGLCIAVEGHV